MYMYVRRIYIYRAIILDTVAEVSTRGELFSDDNRVAV